MLTLRFRGVRRLCRHKQPYSKLQNICWECMCLRTSSLCVSVCVNASATFLGLPCTMARSASEVMDFLIFLSSAVLGNFSRTPPVDLLIPLLNSSFCLLLCFFSFSFLLWIRVLYSVSMKTRSRKRDYYVLHLDSVGMISLQRMLIGCQSWKAKQGNSWAQWA